MYKSIYGLLVSLLVSKKTLFPYLKKLMEPEKLRLQHVHLLKNPRKLSLIM